MKYLVIGIFLILCLGCSSEEGVERHLIPNGYRGPVVVTYNDPQGEALQYDPDGAMVFKIPPSGVLRIKDPRPKPNVHVNQFFFLQADGTRVSTPHNGDPKQLQVMEFLGGRLNNVQEGTLGYKSYVVGIPQERAGNDWRGLRNRAIAEVTGRRFP